LSNYIVVILRIHDTNLLRESEIGNTAATCVIDENVLELHVTMDDTGDFVEIQESANDLAEHGAGIIARKPRAAISLEDIPQTASGTKEHEKVGRMGRLLGGEQGQYMLVAEGGPYVGFVLEPCADAGAGSDGRFADDLDRNGFA